VVIAPRVASALLVNALIRMSARDGGFGAVLARGDETSGAILLEMRQKGQFAGHFERISSLSGGTTWQPAGPGAPENPEENQAYTNRRRSRDPDLWLVELDVPDVERFIVGLSSLD
jgi:hypothetical protein